MKIIFSQKLIAELYICIRFIPFMYVIDIELQK